MLGRGDLDGSNHAEGNPHVTARGVNLEIRADARIAIGDGTMRLSINTDGKCPYCGRLGHRKLLFSEEIAPCSFRVQSCMVKKSAHLGALAALSGKIEVLFGAVEIPGKAEQFE